MNIAEAPPEIDVTDLVRRFGHGHNAVTAVAGVDFHVPAGTVFGLLGPNGAGKTTIVRMLTGLVPPSEGTVRVAGVAIDARGSAWV